MASLASGFPRSNLVAASTATSPPAENPSIPTLAGLTCHSSARLRITRMARWASCIGVFHRVVRILGVSQPVLQHKSRYPDTGQPLADVVPFVIDGEEAMASTRGHHDGYTGSLVGGRQVGGDGGVVNIGDGMLVGGVFRDHFTLGGGAAA